MLAQDLQPNRLVRAKQLIERTLDKLHNDRVGLVIFAGRAYLQVPLTIDYSAMRMMLQNVRPDLVPTQGTVIGDAIDLAIKSFSQKERKYKSLLIISDGEDHDERATSKAKEAAETGIVIHTIGVGSPSGAPLYDEDTKAPKLDEGGQPVISKLNEEELRNLAETGHGTYTLLGNGEEAASRLAENIDSMEGRSMGAISYTDYNSYFQYFLLLALLLLLAEWMIPGARGLEKRTRSKKPAAVVSVLLLCLISTSYVQAQERTLVRKGNEFYQQKKYNEAAAAYQQALQKSPTFMPGTFNLGNTLIQQKKYDAARKVMDGAAKNTKDPALQSGARYNVGNTYMDEQQWQQAVDAYKQALRKNPQDGDAKYNLSYALAKLKQQQGGGGKDKDKDKKDEKKDDQQKDKQQGKDEKKDDPSKDGQDKKDQPKEGDQQQRPQPQPSKLSQQQADNLLKALQQDERKVQDKMQQGKAVPVKLDKDW
jgi:tetratricopeptide (TPR) repeat protein